MADIFNIGKHRFNRIIIPVIILMGIMIFVETIAFSIGLVMNNNISYDVIMLKDGINVIYAIGFVCLAVILLWTNVQEYSSKAMLGIKMLPIKRYSYQLGNVIATVAVLLIYNMCQMIVLMGAYVIYRGDIFDNRFVLAMTRNAMTSTICPLYIGGVLYLIGFVIIFSALLNVPISFDGVVNKFMGTLSFAAVIYVIADYTGRLMVVNDTPYYDWLWNIGGEKGMVMYQYHILIGLIMLVYVSFVYWYNSRSLVGRGKNHESI